MAVKAAVLGYKELIGEGEPPAPAATTTAEGEEAAEATETPAPTPDIKLYTLQKPQGEIPSWEVDSLLRQDLEALLASSSDSDDDDDSLLYRLEEYIPDGLYDYYDSARDWIVETLKTIGVIKKSAAAHDGPREFVRLFR
jgi:protein kinase C substrate 80K-H